MAAELSWSHEHLPPFVNSTAKNPPPSCWNGPSVVATSVQDKSTVATSGPIFTKKDTAADASVDESKVDSSTATVHKKKKKHKRKKSHHRLREEFDGARSPRRLHKKRRRVREILGKSPRSFDLDDSGPSTSLAFGEDSESEDEEAKARESTKKLWSEVRNEGMSPALMAPSMELLTKAAEAPVVPPAYPGPMWPGACARPPVQAWMLHYEVGRKGRATVSEEDGGMAKVEAAITLPCESIINPYGRYVGEEPPPLTPEVLWLTINGSSSAPENVANAGNVSAWCSAVGPELRPESLTETQILQIRLGEVVERKRELAKAAHARAESFAVSRRSVNAQAVETLKSLMRVRPPPMNVYPHNAALEPTFGITTSDDPSGDTSFLVCSICLEPDLARGNQMVICSRCGVACHQYCYEISRVLDEDAWLCRLCQALENGDAHESDDLDCFLCGGGRRCIGGGLMTSVMVHGAIRWLHVRCGMFTWKCGCISDIERAAMRLPRSDTVTSVCNICNKEVGETVKCGAAGCSQHFHISCATQHALTVPEPADHNWALYCRQHMADADAFGTMEKLTKAIAASPYAEQTEGGFAAVIANTAAASLVEEPYFLYSSIDAEDLWLAWMDPGEASEGPSTPKATADRPASNTPPTAAPPVNGRGPSGPTADSLSQACVMCLHTDGDLTDIPGGPGVPPGCSAKIHRRCAHWMGLAPVLNFHDLRQGSVIRPRNFLQCCHYCNSVLGITMKCSKCNRSFHPHCAAKNGCTVRIEEHESGIQLSGRAAELWLSRRTIKGGFAVWVDCNAH